MKNINENLTKSKILASAFELFLEKGFAGTSISMIAKQANINQSLIYHHFKDKQALWEAAKIEFLKQSRIELDLSVNERTDLSDFLKRYINQRFDFYLNNPQSIKLMNLQRLEQQTELRSTQNILSYAKIEQAIVELQNLEKITKKYPSSMIAIHISAGITAALYDHLDYFKESKLIQSQYKKLLLDGFLNAFAA